MNNLFVIRDNQLALIQCETRPTQFKSFHSTIPNPKSLNFPVSHTKPWDFWNSMTRRSYIVENIHMDQSHLELEEICNQLQQLDHSKWLARVSQSHLATSSLIRELAPGGLASIPAASPDSPSGHPPGREDQAPKVRPPYLWKTFVSVFTTCEGFPQESTKAEELQTLTLSQIHP